jgi:hypothetical protein
MRWPGHVGKQKEEKNKDSRSGNSKQSVQSENLGVDGMILKWLLKIEWTAWTGLTWPGVGPRGWGGDFSHGEYEIK